MKDYSAVVTVVDSIESNEIEATELCARYSVCDVQDCGGRRPGQEDLCKEIRAGGYRDGVVCDYWQEWTLCPKDCQGRWQDILTCSLLNK